MERKGCISERILDNERLVTKEKEKKNENNNKKDPLLFVMVFSFLVLVFLHDDLGLGDVGRDRLVWQDRSSVDIDLILNSDIVAQY